MLFRSLEHAVEHLPSLSHPRVAETRGLEIGHPFLDRHTVDVTQLETSEGGQHMSAQVGLVADKGLRLEVRSEERRVGKECRSRWSPYH